MDFDHILAPAGNAKHMLNRGLAVLAEIDVINLPPDHPFVREHPEFFARAGFASEAAADPRKSAPPAQQMIARPYIDPGGFSAWWERELAELAAAGIAGFYIRCPHRGLDIWPHLTAALRKDFPSLLFIAHTPGLSRDERAAIKRCGFDYTVSSLAWWDGRSSWLFEELDELERIAPFLSLVEEDNKTPPTRLECRRTRLGLAALMGQGLIMPQGFETAPGDEEGESELSRCVKRANALAAQKNGGHVIPLTGPGAPLTLILREGHVAALVGIVNASEAAVSADGVLGKFAPYSQTEAIAEFHSAEEKIAPGALRLFYVRQAMACAPASASRERLDAATRASRLAIERVSPTVDGGKYPAKRVAGDTVCVEADIFTDGHPLLGCELQWRYGIQRHWQSAPMHPLGNDRWRGEFTLVHIGDVQFRIRAWLDTYGTFARDLAKKSADGQDVTLDIQEGVLLLRAAAQAANATVQAALQSVLTAFPTLDSAKRAALLLAPETAEAVRRAGSRAFECEAGPYPIRVDRKAAAFASWYELFPRSQTDDAAKHGTFDGVIARLPAIRDMGFDVLYLTPIHPVGRTNRKGRNNAPRAQPGDPGSVYAIGSEEGGHDAIQPELGTLEDFLRLVAKARDHGLEIALDFAVQCSPDHPWLKEHPEWFVWRPDGSMKFAENPPKKYEDIVNVDFYAAGAVPSLWLALRDIVRFWIGQGVKIFRVDNPHTKPFPFWEWLIRDINEAHPEVLFLSEAFTRPAVMQHLAKIGFSQSYTYFTWRNTKAELTAYLRELNAAPVVDFFRPNFFVNTPDINPYYLQSAGRAGFLARAALACTLSGLWGMYSGFELCEHEPLPDREEYADSEKYEIKPRDWKAPGNIVADIARLNRIRRNEPALQTWRGVAFYNALNDNILYFGKYVPGYRDRILVAVNLNPHVTESCAFEIPLWEWSLPDDHALDAEDLVTGEHFVWRGKMQHVSLSPERPYRIWRASPAEPV
jgi:starch synthase (maltosyl-transferring)